MSICETQFHISNETQNRTQTEHNVKIHLFASLCFTNDELFGILKIVK